MRVVSFFLRKKGNGVEAEGFCGLKILFVFLSKQAKSAFHMNEPGFSPYLIAALGIFLFYLGLRALRQKKMVGSEGKEQGLRNPEYYVKLLGSFLGAGLVFFWAGTEFHKMGGWLYSSSFALLTVGILWWLIRFNKIRNSAKAGLRSAMLPRMYSKAKENSPNMWSMAALALLYRVQNRKLYVLGGAQLSNSSMKYARKRLKKEWDIQDQEDFDEVQDWLITEGHRTEFLELIHRIMNSSQSEIQDYIAEVNRGEHAMSTKTEMAEERARVEMIEEDGSKLKNQGFMAWDQLRYMENCGLGYLAGYLDEETAWENLNSVAKALQSRYDSWKDMGEAYLMGREFWSAIDYSKKGRMYEKTLNRLLSDKRSPWNQIKWDMPLLKQ